MKRIAIKIVFWLCIILISPFIVALGGQGIAAAPFVVILLIPVLAILSVVFDVFSNNDDDA